MCLDFDLLRFPADRKYGELAGSGAFNTTANDMAKWMAVKGLKINK